MCMSIGCIRDCRIYTYTSLGTGLLLLEMILFRQFNPLQSSLFAAVATVEVSTADDNDDGDDDERRLPCQASKSITAT